MAAMPEQHERDIYTPQTVERLLGDFGSLLYRSGPTDRDMPRQGKYNSPEPAHSRWETQMCKRADLLSALESLPQPTYQIVYLCCYKGFSLRDAADIVGYSHTTVRHHKVEGLKWMAHRLGWRDEKAGWG